jgi:hypothetical protein
MENEHTQRQQEVVWKIQSELKSGWGMSNTTLREAAEAFGVPLAISEVLLSIQPSTKPLDIQTVKQLFEKARL